ncbi:chromate transporter, partial [Chloroflexota bacterium]
MSPQSHEEGPSFTDLFLSFFRLGLTSFGGPAIVAYIRKLVVEQKRWLHKDVFLDGVAISHTIPGSTAVQNAGYVGLKLRGLTGATICFVAFFLPAFIIMMVLSALYVSFHSLPAVVSAFNGLQAIIVAIVANATISFGLISLKTYRDIIVTVISAIAFFIGVNPAL